MSRANSSEKSHAYRIGDEDSLCRVRTSVSVKYCYQEREFHCLKIHYDNKSQLLLYTSSQCDFISWLLRRFSDSQGKLSMPSSVVLFCPLSSFSSGHPCIWQLLKWLPLYSRRPNLIAIVLFLYIEHQTFIYSCRLSEICLAENAIGHFHHHFQRLNTFLGNRIHNQNIAGERVFQPDMSSSAHHLHPPNPTDDKGTTRTPIDYQVQQLL